MQDTVSRRPKVTGISAPFSTVAARLRSESPSLTECSVATLSAGLLILSFPDFNLWPLAWIGLVPFLLLIARRPQAWRCSLLGWVCGSVFFYGSCYWLTYSMIHFGGIPRWVAFALLMPGALVMGIFPAIFAAMLARALRRWGAIALF